MDSYKLKFQKHLHELTKSEQKVGNYVLDNMESVVHKTVKTLSHEVNVGETTVLRFCKNSIIKVLVILNWGYLKIYSI